MRALFDALYLTGLLLGSPWFLYKAATTGKYRKGLAERFGRIAPRKGENPCVWFHSVSVGELLAAEGLIRRFREAHPDFEVLISVVTKTGYEIAAKRLPDCRLIFFPIDLSWVVKRVMGLIRPALVVLVELELWPNFLIEARSRSIPVLLVNGRISRKSASRYRLGWFALADAFSAVTLWGVQDESCRQRLVELGIAPEKTVVAGNAKYDAIPTGEDKETGRAVRGELGFAEDDLVIVGGSTFAGEEEILLDIFLELREELPRLRLVLAPRHPERLVDVKTLLDSRGADWRAKTSLADEPQPAEVILLDTMGELARIYACADVVFVGKSLCGAGGQNMLEPAARGKAVLFGPNVANFRESVELLLAHEAAVQVPDKETLRREMRELLLDGERRRGLGERARRAVEGRKGATGRYLEMIEIILANLRKEL